MWLLSMILTPPPQKQIPQGPSRDVLRCPTSRRGQGEALRFCWVGFR